MRCRDVAKRSPQVYATPAACRWVVAGPLPDTRGAATGLLLHGEIAAVDDGAVQRDLDLVAAGRPAVRLADVERGHGRAIRRDGLARLVDRLASLVGPLRGQRRARRGSGGRYRRVDRVGRREGRRRRADSLARIDRVAEVDRGDAVRLRG